VEQQVDRVEHARLAHGDGQSDGREVVQHVFVDLHPQRIEQLGGLVRVAGRFDRAPDRGFRVG
jgi:hypothetical protein